MNNLLTQGLLHYYPPFSAAELALGIAQFERRNVEAKTIIHEAGTTCDYLFFAKDAVIRCFYNDSEEQEQTLWMKPEQTFLTEYKSFVGRSASGFSLQLYEDTELYCIHREQLLSLYQSSQAWALFGIHLTEQLHIKLVDVFVNLLANDATANYRYIEYMFPRFLQVAPLKDIASMLQVSPVTLSRIRAGTQTKAG